VLARYGEFVKQLSQEEQLQVADLNTSVIAALERADKLDADLAKKIIPDRVHPAPGGHLLLAEALLKAWHAPAIVTSAEIDAAASKVIQANNTEVSDLAVGDKISWTQTDAALPMPIESSDNVLMLAVRASDFVEALDQEPLKVTGLEAERYVLKIDDEPMGSFTKKELAHGVNLATLATPMARQAARVHDITARHVAVHFARWRLVELNLQNIAVQPAHLRAAADALNVLDAEAIEQQHIAAQPKPHRFELYAEP
jgi:hypothetical protein